MFTDNYWQSIYTFLNQLASSQDTFFREVWGNSRLKFGDSTNQIDDVDMYTAQLVCSAQNQPEPVLVVLPDEASHRIPILFATVLLRQAFNNVYSNRNPQNVVYFGPTASIRDHLSRTYCGEFCLKEIFNQTDLKKTFDFNKPTQSFQNRVPHVIFSNMPINPAQIIDIYRPAWCFIDLGNGERLNWFPSCLTTLQQKQTPIIACVQNPLSDAIQRCEQAGWQVFRWPYLMHNKTLDEGVSVQPLVLQGETVESHAEQYQHVYRSLYALSKKAKGKFASDSLQVIRQYASNLEQLIAPYKFYEAESRRFWGIYSLSDSQQTAQRFVESLKNDNSPLSESLYQVCERLNQIHQQLQLMEEPPLWRTLYNFCVPELEKDSVRLLVFPSEARKTLFALALLAYHNFSTDDLASINVWLVGLKRFNQWQREREKHQGQEEVYDSGIPPLEKLWHPLLIGVPRQDAKYAALLRSSKLDILLYQHQTRGFQYNINQWNQAIHDNHPANLRALSVLTPSGQQLPIRNNGNRISKRVVIATPRQWKVEESEEVVLPKAKELFRVPERVDEVAWLMQSDNNVSPDEQVLLDQTSSKTEIIPHKEMTTDWITHVIFQEGFHVQFPQNATVQLVLETNMGRQLDERSVRSLRVNDIVMFIHGQNRQNLYELIVSRIHAHPSIALYISLIQRWQEEIAERAIKSNLVLEEILNQMRQRGSRLQTPQTIRFWIDGQVLCPNDPSDLQRIAEILKMSFTRQYYQEIARAATRLRGIHIGLSRRLNQWLQHGPVEASSDQIDDFIDTELGITFSDFQDALRLLTVKETKQEEGIFLISDLGKLSKE